MTPNPSADVVSRELRGKVLLVTIDHAPVNALSTDVRRGLLAHVDECDIVTARFHLDRGRSRHLSKSLPRILRAFDHLVPLSRYQCVWLTRRLSSATWRWQHAPPKVAYGLPRPQNRSLRFAW